MGPARVFRQGTDSLAFAWITEAAPSGGRARAAGWKNHPALTTLMMSLKPSDEFVNASKYVITHFMGCLWQKIPRG